MAVGEGVDVRYGKRRPTDEAIGVAACHEPAEPGAVVVADEVEPLLSERIRHRQNVRSHRGMGIVLRPLGPGAGTIALEIRRDGGVPVRRQVLEERQPHVRRFWKPVQQDDEVVPVPRAAHVVGVFANAQLRLLDCHSRSSIRIGAGDKPQREQNRRKGAVLARSDVHVWFVHFPSSLSSAHTVSGHPTQSNHSSSMLAGRPIRSFRLVDFDLELEEIEVTQ